MSDHTEQPQWPLLWCENKELVDRHSFYVYHWTFRRSESGNNDDLFRSSQSKCAHDLINIRGFLKIQWHIYQQFESDIPKKLRIEKDILSGEQLNYRSEGYAKQHSADWIQSVLCSEEREALIYLRIFTSVVEDLHLWGREHYRWSYSDHRQTSVSYWRE